MDELSYKKFAFIGPDFAPYCEQEKLFGEEVYNSFEVARREIKDAGNCLAADLGTAAVFHLMRTAEFGMRALAQERHVKIKNRQLDYADWQTLSQHWTRRPTPYRTGRDEVPGRPQHLSSIGELFDNWRDSKKSGETMSCTRGGLMISIRQ
jgi:hypothetical protein